MFTLEYSIRRSNDLLETDEADKVGVRDLYKKKKKENEHILEEFKNSWGKEKYRKETEFSDYKRKSYFPLLGEKKKKEEEIRDGLMKKDKRREKRTRYIPSRFKIHPELSLFFSLLILYWILLMKTSPITLTKKYQSTFLRKCSQKPEGKGWTTTLWDSLSPEGTLTRTLIRISKTEA
ncbi:hypothetical protein HZH66_012880 [Vespula vulgaris]|uniref:Uncharacterized protein n=1 Tax=Vespula vulgaris TaxID=7454 RepID=A0A834J8S5_VESVU|nr:hypothetical protein HZH66_012880 [Vespula vulgaris]